MQNKDHDFFFALDRDILAIQLLEVSIALIRAIEEWAEDNGIILGESKKLHMLLNEARCLIEELDHVQFKKRSRRIFTGDKSDDNFTESRIKIFNKHG